MNEVEREEARVFLTTLLSTPAGRAKLADSLSFCLGRRMTHRRSQCGLPPTLGLMDAFIEDVHHLTEVRVPVSDTEGVIVMPRDLGTQLNKSASEIIDAEIAADELSGPTATHPSRPMPLLVEAVDATDSKQSFFIVTQRYAK